MIKKKILYVDDNHTEIDSMKDLFTDARLSALYDFDSIHCPFVSTTTWEKHKDDVLLAIYNKKAGVNLVMLDMILTGSPTNRTPLSLEIADTLKSDNSNTFDIILVTGFTTRNTLLTHDPKWNDNKFLHRDKPKLKIPLSRVSEGACPPAQGEVCSEKNNGKCTHKDCFIKYMEMLSQGGIGHV